jgi:hypothetical protein
MMGPSFGLLTRIKLTLDPPFPARGLDQYDNRSVPRTATRRHFVSQVTKAAPMPSEPVQGKQQTK